MEKVFVVGCPRSGTTLLQSILAGHSKVVSCPETRLLSNTMEITPWGKLLKIYGKSEVGYVNDMMGRLGYKGNPLEPGSSRVFSSSAWVRYILSALDKLGESLVKNNETIFLEKTPRHLHFIEEITRVERSTKFIHILRNGVDVVRSMEKATSMNTDIWERRDTDKCIFWWNRSIKLSKKYIGRPRHFFVTYQSLIDTPKEIAQKICDFMDIDFEEGMVTNQAKTAEELIFDYEDWKKNNLKPIIKKKTKEDFYTPDQLALINKKLLNVRLEDFCV